MDEINAILAFAALAQGTRLHAFRMLVGSEPNGLAAGEIARRLIVPQNTMSSHLSVLARAGLVTAERHSRSIVYRANLDRARDVVTFLLKDCCGGHHETCSAVVDALAPCCSKESLMEDRVFNVLFLCTGNSARSILGEAVLNKDGRGRFKAYSAGSHPKGEVNPFALKVVANLNFPTDGLYSKPWDVFAEPGAPVMDFVFTVCDDAAGEVCPVWPGQPMTAHWGIEDPAKVEGTDLEKEAAFVQALKYMKTRIGIFTNLPMRGLSALSLQKKLHEIGEIEGVTSRARVRSRQAS